MSTVTSKDGTRIAYERIGSGPSVILVDGAFCRRSFGPARALAKRLAPRFTAVLYDRRGRGDSGDAPEYRVEREIEDLAAIAGALDETPFVYGTSSGAVLAARAVAAGVPARKLAVYEPPLALDGTHHPSPPDFRERIAALLSEGRRGDAVKLFMQVVGVPRIGLAFMRLIPGVFRGLKDAAHTLPHDFAILGDTQSGGPLPAELEAALRSIRVPTLAMVGGKSPAWMSHACRRVAEVVSGARTDTLPRQTHNVSAKSMAPALVRFFTEE
jgi:pimeloyl-ACP methyl ester carboxylesterase